MCVCVCVLDYVFVGVKLRGGEGRGDSGGSMVSGGFCDGWKRERCWRDRRVGRWEGMKWDEGVGRELCLRIAR